VGALITDYNLGQQRSSLFSWVKTE